MKPGEYLFNQTEHININKPFIGDFMVDRIFGNPEFIEAVADELNLLPVYNPEDSDYEKVHKKFSEERDKKESNFFNQFRKLVQIPDYLKNDNLMIADLHFEESKIPQVISKISSLKFIFKSYTRYFPVRVRYKLPVGKCMLTVESHSEELLKYTETILIEGLESSKDDMVIKNIPKGKKAVFVSYETVGNLSVYPVFHTSETLTSNIIQDCMVFNKTILLEEKGQKGYNKYMTFAGFVDEHVSEVDFELFQLIVTFECGKEYVLI